MVTNNTQKGMWDLIQLVCGECKSPLEIKEGPWGCFYSCNDYPECFNRMNTDVYEKILDKIIGLLSEYEDINLTGYKWTLRTSHQNYVFKIERQLPERFIISVINIKKTREKQ